MAQRVRSMSGIKALLVSEVLDSLLQKINPVGGGARHCGIMPVATEGAFSSRWASIVWITNGSSILAMILTSLPHSLQVSISILNTRFKRCAQVIAA